MNFERIKNLNNNIEVKNINDKSFDIYGRIVNEYDFAEIVNYMENNTKTPEDGNIYIASVSDMEKTSIYDDVKNHFYGQMPVQIGYCNGKNSTLNGLEYHKCSEINVAVTDLVLLLGRVQDIENNKYESKKVEAFYVPKGTSIEIYATTLHFAPCKVEEEGFKCVVILAEGTNQNLEEKENMKGEDELLFAKNKWLIVHESRQNLIEKGAYVGIEGENVRINY